MQDQASLLLKLYGKENYADWEKLTQRGLEEAGLWLIVQNGTAKHGETATSMDQYTSEQDTRRYIIDRLGDAPFKAVVYEKRESLSPAQLWNELKLRYQEHGYPLLNNLASEAIEMRWNGKTSLDDHVDLFSRMMKRLNDATSADGRQPVPEWMQVTLLLRSIEGVDENVQKGVVDVLRAGDLRKKTGELTLAEIAQDFKNFRYFAKGLEFYRSGEGKTEGEQGTLGWVEISE